MLGARAKNLANVGELDFAHQFSRFSSHIEYFILPKGGVFAKFDAQELMTKSIYSVDCLMGDHNVPNGRICV